MTVIKLTSGELFINNPVAPTPECVAMIKEIELKHGKVKYIVLSSLAIEHKGTVGIFSKYFPTADIYYQPGQYSFPFNLPINFFLPFGRTVKEIPYQNKDAPWSADLDHEVLGPLKPPQVGGFGETGILTPSDNPILQSSFSFCSLFSSRNEYSFSDR